METNEQIDREREELRRFDRWRKHVKYHLPSLARRVFALRPGHSDIEAELGYVIARVNAQGYNYPRHISDRIVMEVRVEGFMMDLQRAEFSDLNEYKWPADLQAEIEYMLDTYEDEVKGNTQIYRAINDIYDSDQCLPKWRRPIHEFLIKLGVYKVISDTELSEMIVMSSRGNRKKHAFIFKGQKYVFDKHPDFYFDN